MERDKHLSNHRDVIDREEKLRHTIRYGLRDSTLREVLKRRKTLQESGAIPSFETEQQLREWVTEIFRLHEERHMQSISPEEEERRYAEVVDLLCITGIACPITLDDWSVDRIQSASDALGIKGFEVLEEEICMNILGDDIPQKKMRHLHKGPGNGALMYHLRKGEDEMADGEKRSHAWQEVGLGDKMFYPLEQVLERHINRSSALPLEVRERVLTILTTSLKRALNKAWEGQESKGNRDWVPGKIPDLNDIFRLLAQPETYLDKSYLAGSRTFIGSKEFDGDDAQKVDAWSHEFLVRYARSRKDTVRSAHMEVLFAERNALVELRKYLRECQQNRNIPDGKMFEAVMDHKSASRNVEDMIAEVASEIERSEGVITEERAKTVPISTELLEDKKRLELQIADLSVRIAAAAKRGEPEAALKEQKEVLLKQAATLKSAIQQQKKAAEDKEKEELLKPSTAQVHEDGAELPDDEMLRCIQQLFNSKFVEAVKQHHLYDDPTYRKKGVPLDLNKSGPRMYLHGFIHGMFDQVPKIFPKESFNLVTSVRGESHVPTSEYTQDVANTLATLKPGGVYLTDGARESSTRILRCREIIAAAKDDPSLKVEGVFDNKTHELISVLVQKEADVGVALMGEAKRAVFRDDVYFLSLQRAIARRPDLRSYDHVNRGIFASSGGNKKIFQHLRALVRDKHERLLTRFALGKVAQNYPDMLKSNLVHQVRRAIQELIAEKPPAERKLYGTVDQRHGMPPSALVGRDFFQVRSAIMQHFGAANEPEQRKVFDRIVFECMAHRFAINLPSSHEKGVPDVPELDALPDDASDELQSRVAGKAILDEVRQHMLSIARNAPEYEKKPFIDDLDVLVIIEKMEYAIREDFARVCPKHTLDLRKDRHLALRRGVAPRGDLPQDSWQ